MNEAHVLRYRGGEECRIGDVYLNEGDDERALVAFHGSERADALHKIWNERGMWNEPSKCTLLRRADATTPPAEPVPAPPPPIPSPYPHLAAFTALCREVVSGISKDVGVVTDACGSDALVLRLRLSGHKERPLKYRVIDMSAPSALRSDVGRMVESYLRETDPRRKR